jgi:S-adenosylmethionine:tRNA ribosyltransferase-isomerase
VRLKLFDYPLPPERIAQHPAEPRDSARLLVLDPTTRTVQHRRVADLPDYLHPGDLLVFNDTRVLSARLRGQKETGGAVEALLLRRMEDHRWLALIRPGRRVPPGTSIRFGAGELVARAGARETSGVRELVFTLPTDPHQLDALIERTGEVPLPPYITAPLGDPERYQTVFARVRGSAAAPTAGLHFTPQLLDAIRSRGADWCFITLHVGVATFRPVRTENIEAHEMHVERYAVPEASRRSIAGCAGRVIAVGTTTARCLEAAATGYRQVRPGEAETDLYIRPGFHFQVVDALLTNFHQPRSSLLILTSAFAGYEVLMGAYGEALRRGYRFLSFGDAMFITRRGAPAEGPA